MRKSDKLRRKNNEKERQTEKKIMKKSNRLIRK
jgi:hypothetical protein